MPLSDVELMMKVKAGSKSAFNKIVKRHQGRLINFFYRNIWDKSLAEDFAQEVFIRLYRASKNYAPQAKFTTFLYRIAKNYLIDYYRTKGTKPKIASIHGSKSSDENDFQILDAVSSNAKQPDREASSVEIGEAIKDAISKLPEDQRIVFVMGELDGIAYQEISEILKIPLGTVKSRMHASFIKLRKLLVEFAPYDTKNKPENDKK